MANRPTMAPEHGVALPAVLGHLAEGPGQGERDGQQQPVRSRLVKPVGFSKGWPALALKGPPPLVPSCLIASWEADRAAGDALGWPATVVTMWVACRFCSAPWAIRTTAATTAIGRRTRTTIRVRSTQKFPRVFDCLRTSPRMRATATAMPTAADTKFCTASPAIWVNWDMVSSPA